MRTIASALEQLLPTRPFLEDGLREGILNFSSLATYLKEDLEKILGKSIKEGAIIMALRRYNTNIGYGSSVHIKKALSLMGDITVRNDLINYTYKNSSTLMVSKSKLLLSSEKEKDLFYTFSRGIHESNFIISVKYQDMVEKLFKAEKLIAKASGLNSITINLPENTSKVSGLYYHIFKQLAWNGINIFEVVSTTNEFTILVENKYVNEAFSVLNSIRL
ncbi:MAG: hypothetical protein H6604_04990 [Flavobacteriales bacterium]|nr:hypothetical protein [Flavobacteriales bacterium]